MLVLLRSLTPHAPPRFFAPKISIQLVQHESLPTAPNALAGDARHQNMRHPISFAYPNILAIHSFFSIYIGFQTWHKCTVALLLQAAEYRTNSTTVGSPNSLVETIQYYFHLTRSNTRACIYGTANLMCSSCLVDIHHKSWFHKVSYALL